MAKSTIVAARMERAHARTLEFVREHGPAERVERLESIPLAQVTTSNPTHLAGFQAELMASLAEIVEGQERRIARLEKGAKSGGSVFRGPKKGTGAS